MLMRILLFISSYSPLFTLLAIRFDQAWLRLVCAGLSCLGLVSFVLIFWLDGKKAKGAYRVVSVADAGSQVAGYLASYLLPFLTVSTPSTKDIVAYSVFLAVVCAVYVKTSLLQINPVLYLFRWQVFEIQDSRGFRGFVISRNRIVANSDILATRFGDNVLIDRTGRVQAVESVDH
ncbi:hypothetical protein [Micromonospora tulbaghiae]|uniref:hypothetical protein n=1 Tax=Micromonospora tulbaghiae TaxID=479978 RepID=UPI0029C17FD2|nr:hypothetical protein [Micromonospora tulbaghiae]MDX5460192.1 hypothetical protein [Micromonospora tulbaghiae]